MSEYLLRGEIGRGGMAVVYAADRVLPSGTVLPAACKALHAELAEDEDVLAFFEREASVSLHLTGEHPNLVTVHDFRRHPDGRLMIVMERVDGISLRALLAAGPLPAPVVRRIVRDVLRALAYIHAEGVLHRDVSPENILIARRGVVKLSDFGLSKVLADLSHRSQPTFKGKAPYASPQAIQCQTLDARADLWSLAAITHELLAGEAPFGRGDILRVLAAQTDVGPIPLPEDVPDDLRLLTSDLAIVEREARRFTAATEMLDVLARDSGAVASEADLAALVATMRRPEGLSAASTASTERKQPAAEAPAPPAPAAQVPARRRVLIPAVWALVLVAAVALSFYGARLLAGGDVAGEGPASSADGRRLTEAAAPAPPADTGPPADSEHGEVHSQPEHEAHEPAARQPPRRTKPRPRLPSQTQQEVHVVPRDTLPI